MSVLTMCRRAVVAGLAAGLAVNAIAAAGATEISPPAATAPPAARSVVVKGRVHVPPGILHDVPSGGDPNLHYGRRLAYAAPPVVFAPTLGVPAVVVAPLIYELAPPVETFVPIDFWPCFVPTEHTGQFGHYGSCAESYFREFTNRPD